MVTLFIPICRTATVTLARKPEPGWNLVLYFQFSLGRESKQYRAAHYGFCGVMQQSSVAKGLFKYNTVYYSVSDGRKCIRRSIN